MRTVRKAPGLLGLIAVVLASLLGCTSSGVPGTGMMNGYAYSRLTCTPPAGLAGRVVTVTLADMGMTRVMGPTTPMGSHMLLRIAPSAAPSGVVTIVVQNLGWRDHELLVLPLPAGQRAGSRVPGPDGTVDEAGSLGEASGDCTAGAGEGIPVGSAGWVTLTLSAGRYELLCNLPNHYAAGMYGELAVTG